MKRKRIAWDWAPPSGPGFYFMRRMESDIDVVEVKRTDGGVLWWVGANWDGDTMEDTREVEWAGPIAPPEEES